MPQPRPEPRTKSRSEAQRRAAERAMVAKTAGEDISDDDKPAEGKAYLGRLTGETKTGEKIDRPAVARTTGNVGKGDRQDSTPSEATTAALRATEEDASMPDFTGPKEKAEPGRAKAQAAADVFSPEDVPETWTGGGGYRYRTIRDDGGIQKIEVTTPDGKTVLIDRETPNQEGDGKMLYDILAEFRREGDLAGKARPAPAEELDLGRTEIKARPPGPAVFDRDDQDMTAVPFSPGYAPLDLFSAKPDEEITVEGQRESSEASTPQAPTRPRTSFGQVIGKGLGDTLLFKDSPEADALQEVAVGTVGSTVGPALQYGTVPGWLYTLFGDAPHL